jgi:hypothetical protein
MLRVRVTARLASSLLVAIVCAIVAGGCGSEDAVSTGETEGGFTTYTVESSGFSLGVPRAWDAVSADDVTDSEELDALVDANPELAPFVEQLRSAKSPIKFVAGARDLELGSIPSVSVSVAPVPAGTTVERYLESVAEQAKSRLTLDSLFETKIVDHPAGEAGVARFVVSLSLSGQKQAIAYLQYLFIRGTSVYGISYSVAEGVEERYREFFENSAETFRFL